MELYILNKMEDCKRLAREISKELEYDDTKVEAFISLNEETSEKFNELMTMYDEYLKYEQELKQKVNLAAMQFFSITNTFYFKHGSQPEQCSSDTI